MINWINRIGEYRKVSREEKFLKYRTEGENGARHIINLKCGNFNKIDFMQLFTLCNKECVPPDINTTKLKLKESSTRFGSSINGNNVILMIESLDECNQFVADIWEATTRKDTIDILDRFWNIGKIRGAGVGFPTIVLYLKDPEKYNIWLPCLSKALDRLPKEMSNKYIHKERTNVSNYLAYNDSVNFLFRSHYTCDPSILPQEIDYLLFRISKEGE